MDMKRTCLGIACVRFQRLLSVENMWDLKVLMWHGPRKMWQCYEMWASLWNSWTPSQWLLLMHPHQLESQTDQIKCSAITNNQHPHHQKIYKKNHKKTNTHIIKMQFQCLISFFKLSLYITKKKKKNYKELVAQQRPIVVLNREVQIVHIY